MTTRLLPLLLTEDDYEIFLSRWSQTDNGRFFRLCRNADRRDADLMLYAQQHKRVTWVGPPVIEIRNSVAAYWADPPFGKPPPRSGFDLT